MFIKYCIPALRYLLPAFLLFLIACKTNEETPTPEPEIESITAADVTLPEALFTDINRVGLGNSSTVILDRLIGLINATPKSESIHLSIFLFKYPALVAALKDAHKRGVKLHLMIDMSREESIEENPLTVVELRNALKENSEVITVTSDASSIAINHNKFVLFSEVHTKAGIEKNVVFQTSHNFNLSDTRKIQNAVTIAHTGLYQAFRTYWEDMKAKAETGMKDFEYREYHDPAIGIEAHFLPKRKNGTAYGGDTIVELLDEIENPATATVRIGMSDWTSTRMNIVQKLSELRAQGARVEVIVKSSIAEDILQALRELEQQGAYLKVYNMTSSSQTKVNIHSKFIMIDGDLKGKRTKLLLTGSHNFTQNALRNNNEVMIKFWDSPLYQKYEATFAQLKNIPGI
ncbi:phosphatidylserine/phosphatidylglycerophosphate/cardiolipin synthase family protein [uncultured Pontibacter sp.]|uniref:phospholipase D-like domain-containing protein n=1 Tax=uncultured Pontibacter sp. TaxID=453356 RepID=UPI002620FDEE|nr:phospholipase D-like domain-containing protein [uncultured Pontibacter sp.]